LHCSGDAVVLDDLAAQLIRSNGVTDFVSENDTHAHLQTFHFIVPALRPKEGFDSQSTNALVEVTLALMLATLDCFELRFGQATVWFVDLFAVAGRTLH
jgi:hypothetical protein